MRSFYILAVGSIGYVSALSDNPLLQLLSLVVLIGVVGKTIIDLVSVSDNLRSQRWWMLGRDITALLLFFAAINFASITKDALFEYRLPQYEKAVSQITSKLETSDDVAKISLVDQYKNLAYEVLFDKTTSNIITIEFHTGGGFPVRHQGYLYRSNDNVNNDAQLKSRWPYLRRLQPCWYAFAD